MAKAEISSITNLATTTNALNIKTNEVKSKIIIMLIIIILIILT